ncbi:MAG TPA: AraC family transcriptional regulator [Clostridia bacterium]|nr:AraC family transcriptional regulator [Clostridia bacterium]
MKLSEFAEALEMKVLAGNDLSKDVTGVYVGDLLSWVMSHAEKGNAWITVLTNLNTVAVAVLTEVACIIIPERIDADEQTVIRAQKEGVVILGSQMTAYEICCSAYNLLKQEKQTDGSSG